MGNSDSLWKRIQDDVAKYSKGREMVRANFIDILTVRHLPPDQMHANPDDDFVNPKVGPNEQIIEKYYFDIINESRDPDVVNRISNMVKDQTDIHYDALRKRLDEILFLAIKNDLGNKVLYDNSDLMPQTVNERRAYEMINRKDSFWDEALNSYIAERKGRIYADLGMIWRSKL